ncbi:MAG TPA: amidase family protein [Gaiellaceae bacterium]|jgi:amidase|nr:amidase family protein [Gaiellaceae bacterium]
MSVEPGVEQIIDVASSLGFTLTVDEAQIYQAAIVTHLHSVDAFLNAELDEDRPPMVCPEREPGHAPAPDDDPYRAWTWRCRIGSNDTGLLSGKTVSFKDHISVAGIPQQFNSGPMAGFVPDFDATVVTRVLESGGTVVGKNVMDGFMGGSPRPINPHDPQRVAGGSSSGSAVAVAAGEVDISFGGDQGGSLRHPAAYCGIVGLKPTFGLVSHFGVGFGAEESVDHVGPLSRRVEDAAIALEAVAGFDHLDPRQRRDIPERLDVLHTLEAGVRGLKIGILHEGFDEPIDSDVHDTVMAAVDVLAGAGAEVEHVSIPAHREIESAFNPLIWGGAKAIFGTSFFGMWSKTYYPADVIQRIGRMWAEQAEMLPPMTKCNYLVAEFSRRIHHGAAYAKAQNVRSAFVRAYDEALARVDVLVLPTSRHVAPSIETPLTDPLAALEANLTLGQTLRAATYNLRSSNYTGHPALALPCGKVDGLPVSIQLIGRFLEDPLLLRVAYAYQESVDWGSISGIDAVPGEGRPFRGQNPAA